MTHSWRSLAGLNLLGSLHSVPVAILLSSGNVSNVSASSSSSVISSLSLGGPVISSLLGVESTATLGILSILLVEIRSSSVSTHTMGVSVLLTSRWGTSSHIPKNNE